MSEQKTALIIDDEPDIRELLSITLGRMGITTSDAADVRQAKKQLQHTHFDLCLTDMRLPDGTGLDIVEYIQQQQPDLPVAVITAHGSMDMAIESMKAGAFDFVSKPVELEQLRQLIHTALNLTSSIEKAIQPSNIIGETDKIKRLRQQIQKLSRSQAPIYISGESGSGKELVARAIHYQGPRSNGPFIAVNCGAIPAELMESEFFGHKKGSFTGANQDKQGLFQAANGGTLFLDEVADLPLDMQVKLLRALQEKAIRAVGSESEVRVDVRILSATHKDLAKEVEHNHFRSDLFYRINVIEIKVPSLRERQDDIPLLAEKILKQLAGSLDLPAPTITIEALQALTHYPFPGNVRELENILERAFTLCESDAITAQDLQLPQNQSVASNTSGQTSSAPDYQFDQPLDDYLENIEKTILETALEKARWNRTEAAKQLGISFRSIRYRLKKLGLDEE